MLLNKLRDRSLESLPDPLEARITKFNNHAAARRVRHKGARGTGERELQVDAMQGWLHYQQHVVEGSVQAVIRAAPSKESHRTLPIKGSITQLEGAQPITE